MCSVDAIPVEKRGILHGLGVGVKDGMCNFLEKGEGADMK